MSLDCIAKQKHIDQSAAVSLPLLLLLLCERELAGHCRMRNINLNLPYWTSTNPVTFMANRGLPVVAW
jgi:hypothetical protein